MQISLIVKYNYKINLINLYLTCQNLLLKCNTKKNLMFHRNIISIALFFNCLMCLNSLDFINKEKIVHDGDLKLVDGPTDEAGTVLVYRTYGWGRICDDHWTMKEAGVVCRQLKMGHALEAHRRNKFGSVIRGKYFLKELILIINILVLVNSIIMIL